MEIHERTIRPVSLAEFSAGRNENSDEVRWFTKAIEAHLQSDLDVAAVAYLEALRSEQSFEGYLNLALCQRDQGKVEQAIHSLLCAVKIEPRLRVAYVELATLYEDMGDIELSAQYHQRSLQL